MSFIKNQFGLILATIATVLAITIGISFAYFLIVAGAREESDLVAITEDVVADLTITKTCDLEINISYEDMSRVDGTSEGTPITGNTCELTAKVSTVNPVTCKYKTTYTKTSGINVVYSSENTTKKPEYILDINRNLQTGVTASADITSSTIDLTEKNEIVIDRGNISWPSNSNSLSMKYDITQKFMNYNFVQNENSDKTVTGEVKLEIYDCAFGDEPYEAPAIVLTNDLNSNGKADVGDKVCIGGTECFYVISNKNDTVKALAEWNLLVGNQFDGSTTTPIENQTGMQSETARGWHPVAGTTNVEYPSIGTVAFSSAQYWPSEVESIIDTTDSRNLLYPYLILYKTNLERLGVSINKIGLISMLELENLLTPGSSLPRVGSIKSLIDSKGYSWIYNTSYWLSESSVNNGVLCVHGSGTMSNYYYGANSIYGIRPVIEFSKYEIEGYPAPVSFETDSWDVIKNAVKTGNTSMYHLGDTKTIRLAEHVNDCPTYKGSGTSDSPYVCGAVTTTPEKTYQVRIANMSSPDAECNNPNFSQTACGFVVEFAEVIENHLFNPGGLDTANGTSSNEYIKGSNRGGYPASSIYNFINGTLYNAFPKEVRDVMIPTKVVSGYGSLDTNNFVSTDKLYLLDSKEIYGPTFTSSSNKAKDVERQLDYYESIGVTSSSYSGAIKKLGTSNKAWWVRSAYSNLSDNFYIVNFDGYSGRTDAYTNYGVSVAFRIG